MLIRSRRCLLSVDEHGLRVSRRQLHLLTLALSPTTHFLCVFTLVLQQSQCQLIYIQEKQRSHVPSMFLRLTR